MITLPNGNSIDLDMLETAVLATCAVSRTMRSPIQSART